MSALVTVMLIGAGMSIEITLAPDEPIPHVYVDDPLLLELKSEADTEGEVQVMITSSAGEITTIPLGKVALRAREPVWQSIPGAPAERGRYQGTVTVTIGGEVVEKTATFCRIDRPVPSLALPIGVYVLPDDPHALEAMAAISLRRIRLDADHGQLSTWIEEAGKAGFDVAVAFGPERLQRHGDLPERLARRYGDRVVRWDVAVEADGNPSFDVEPIVSGVRALREGGSLAPVALVVKQPEELAWALSEGLGKHIAIAVVEDQSGQAPDVTGFRNIAEAAGHERMPLYLLSHMGHSGNELSGCLLTHRIVDWIADQVEQVLIDLSLVYANGEFSEEYVLLGALARRLQGSVYVGRLPLDSSVRAPVFRCRDAWCVMVWSEDGGGPVRLRLGAASDLSFADARNNPLPTPPLSPEGEVRIEAGLQPSYLCGTKGTVLSQAASHRAREEADRLANVLASGQEFPKELVELVRNIANQERVKVSRPDFFALVRTFPFLERQWRLGALPASSVAPALASLTRLISHLSVVEQEVGEPFIEPLQDILNRCSQYQSLYLTRTGGAVGGGERGDWLLAEVGRLVALAERLDEEGRPIEARAIATMAEWRARSLEFAVQPPPGSFPDLPAGPREETSESS